MALVSGGSRGIGAATVRRLAADGWDIGFSYHGDGPSAREVEKAAFELGVRVTGTDVDITDAAEVGSWFRLTEAELGPVQAVVSCAGITRERPLAQLEEADWRMVIDTSLDGVFHLCRAAVFAMMQRRSGRIVTVSSVCGEYDHVPRGADTMARPGIAGFVGALASQTRRFGITVNAVAPGSGARDLAALLPERPRADLAETIALRRFGNAADVADLVAFLLSEDASDITGRVLEVPGAIEFLASRFPHQPPLRHQLPLRHHRPSRGTARPAGTLAHRAGYGRLSGTSSRLDLVARRAGRAISPSVTGPDAALVGAALVGAG